MCDKDSNMINENISEEEFYETQGKEYDEDLKKIHEIVDKCSSRLFENKIVVVNNNDVDINNYFNRQSFIGKVDDLNKEEDFINSHTRVSIKENEENGIMVIY
ncbi:hypothetical protein, partial [Clostridium sp.]|uniref:hypothetical protein n=1 Tax=Clostridium sp. TaxID=1506 RepID=UPI0026089AD8